MNVKQLRSRREIVNGLGALASMSIARRAHGQTSTTTVVEQHGLNDLFSKVNAVGTMVVFNPQKNAIVVSSRARAETRFVPASMFKLANAVIALETGAVKDENEIIPWGGKPQSNKAWERNMSIREALPMSNVPIFQEAARRVGIERYQNWLPRLNYGNAQIGRVVDRFWLDGPLEISAIEQVRFVSDLAHGKLAASERSQRLVREMSLLEEVGGVRVYGKTGWTGPDRAIGWISGWVERGPEVTSFALNMDMKDVADAPKRMAIAKAALSQLRML